MSFTNTNENQNKRGDRSGMSTVEFSLLLPFLALLAGSLFSMGYFFFRSAAQTHATFSAARRCAVSGRASWAQAFVGASYGACLTPGLPSVSADFSSGEPGRCRVTVQDSFLALRPAKWGGLLILPQRGATVTVTAAGVSPVMGGDNDL